MKSTTFIPTALLTLLISTVTQGQTNDTLRQEIIVMFQNDQEIRRAYVFADETANLDSLDKAMTDADERNTLRMKEIVDKYGWPTNKTVGDTAAGAAIYLLTHADRDTAFQTKCWTLMNAAAEKNEIPKMSYAIFTDRILVNKDKQQLYGTQGTCSGNRWQPATIQDRQNLDKRRQDVGLPPFAEYKTMMDTQCNGRGK